MNTPYKFNYASYLLKHKNNTYYKSSHYKNNSQILAFNLDKKIFLSILLFLHPTP